MKDTLKSLVEGLLNTLDPSNDVLTESVKSDMTATFVEAVSEAVEGETNKIDEAISLQMDSLNEQITQLKESHAVREQEIIDEGVAAIASIDEAFADQIDFAIDQFDIRAVEELERCKVAFDESLETELDDLAESVEQLIENSLEANVPDEDLSGLAQLAQYKHAFESMRDILFKDVVLDQKVTESVGSMKTNYDRLVTQNIALNKQINKIKVDKHLATACEGMNAGMKDYLVERFENAKLSDIQENWEAAQEDFKALNEENRRLAKEGVKELEINKQLDEDLDEDVPTVENVDPYAAAANAYAKMF